MRISQAISAGLVLAASLASMAVSGAPASARTGSAASVNPALCWIEDRDREWSGSLLFFARAGQSGRYALTIRQNHGLQQLLAEQSGDFHANGPQPTLLSSIFVRSLEQVEDIGLTSPDTSRAGNLTSIRGQRAVNAPEPMAARGYTAHLQVFDGAGRRICEYLY